MSQNDSQTHHHHTNNVETKTTLQTPPLSSKPHPILTLQLKESQNPIFPSNSNTLFAKTMTSTNSTSTKPLPSSDDIAAKAVNKRYEGLVTVRTKAIKGKGAWYWNHLESILVRNPDSGLPKSVKLKCSLCEAVFYASNPSRTASVHLKRGTCSNFNNSGLKQQQQQQQHQPGSVPSPVPISSVSGSNRKRGSPHQMGVSVSTSPTSLTYQNHNLALVEIGYPQVHGSMVNHQNQNQSLTQNHLMLSGGKEDLCAFGIPHFLQSFTDSLS